MKEKVKEFFKQIYSLLKSSVICIFEKIIPMLWFYMSIVLLFYAFEWSRNVVKQIIIAFFNKEIMLDVYWKVKKYKVLANTIWLYILIIYIAFFISKRIYMKIKCFKLKKIIKQQSNLNMELFKYINGIDPTCFLIYGNWGSGKTISVNEFMDYIKRINYRKVYTISCFGITTREALYKKIQDECENEDKSLKRRVVDISKSIPVIGNLIYSLLKKDYEIASIKPKSVFVFDDFERVAPTDSIKSDQSSKANVSYSRTSTTHLLGKEFENEMKLLHESINQLDRNNYYQTQYSICDKYNLITSLINEIQERYKMRVIIIANMDFIPPNILNDIIDTKLAVKKYKVKANNLLFQELSNLQIDSIITLSKKERNFLKDIIENNKCDFDSMWKVINIENCRVLNDIVAAFIYSVDKYNLYFNYELCESLLYSILLAKVSLVKGLDDIIKDMKMGENPIIYLYRHCNNGYGNELKLSFLNLYRNRHDLRWCGYQLSFERFVGLYIESNIENMINSIMDYDNTFAKKLFLGQENTNIQPKNLKDMFICLSLGNSNIINRIKVILQNNEFTITDDPYVKSSNSPVTNIIQSMSYYNIKQIYDNDNLLKELLFKLIKSCDIHSENDRFAPSMGSIFNDYLEWCKNT